jgi:hypothetical protein
VAIVLPCALALVLMSGAPPWRDPGTPPHEGDTANRLRLHFDIEALHWVGGLAYSGQGGPVHIRHEAAGAFGYHRFALGFGLGWGLGEYVLLGARGDILVFPDRDAAGNQQMSRGGSFSPYVEILFARMRMVRPFFLARAGIGAMSSFKYDDGAYQGKPRRTIVPSIGVGVGTHAFINEDISFDIALTLDHRWNLRPREGTIERGFVMGDSKLIAAVMLGFSRWF